MIRRLWSWVVSSARTKAVSRIAAGVLALIGLRSMWRSQGATDQRKEAEHADLNRANEIREDARKAAARASDDRRDVDERLREHGRLRD